MALVKSVVAVILGGLLLVGIPCIHAGRIYHRMPCLHRSDCGNVGETYLMCFQGVSGEPGRCLCTDGQKFDFTTEACRIEAGRACKVGHHGIKCTTGTVCKPRTSTEGICECVSGSQDEDCVNQSPPLNPPAPTTLAVQPKIESQIAAAPVSSSTSLLNKSCKGRQSQDQDCNSKSTFLQCFDMGSGSKCLCRQAHVWDQERKQCVVKRDGECLIGGQRCEAGTACQRHQDLKAEETKLGTCVDTAEKKVVDLTISQVGDRAETINEIQKSSSTTKEIARSLGVMLLGKSCRADYQEDDCGTKQTWLRCIQTPSGYKCVCRHLHYFDTIRNMCVIKIGGECDFNPNSQQDIQPCVQHAKCMSEKNLRDTYTPKGTCCLASNTAICQESEETYREVSKPNTAALVVAEKKERNYKDRRCIGRDSENSECGSESTFLSCMPVQENVSRCVCSKVHQFDETTNKCAIKVGGSCSLDKPQSCVSGAKCLTHRNLDDKETREGTCCQHGDSKLCGTPSSIQTNTVGSGRAGVGTPERFSQNNEASSVTPLIFVIVTTSVLAYLAQVTL